jgi:membrane protein
MTTSPRRASSVLRRAVSRAREDNVTTMAQALAYSLFLAIPAVALVVLGVFSLLANPATIQGLVGRAHAIMPAEAVVLLQSSLERSARSTSSGVLMTVLGLALALWTTTSAATTLMQGLTRAYDVRDERGFVRKRLVAFLIVLALVASAALVVGLLILGPHLERWLGSALGAPSVTAWTWWTAQWPLLFAALSFAFAAILFLGPNVEERNWKAALPGALVAVVVWLAASGGFALYAANFDSYNKSWGTLSAVVITLVWLWLTSAALLFGAEVNSAVRSMSRDGARVPVTGAARGTPAPRSSSPGRASG